MGLWICIAIGLAMDAFAVALATSVALRRVSPRQVFRLAFHFGLFQALMPVAGWGLGHAAVGLVAAWDHWLAFGLLAFVGGKAIRGAIQGEEVNPTARPDPTRGPTLVMLSVATSIDALAVGLTLGVLETPIWTPAVVIGVVTGALTTAGMLLGARFGRRLGRWAEGVGGGILLVIGIHILITHLRH